MLRQLRRHRPLRRQLDRGPPAQPPGGRRAADQGAGEDPRRRARADRAAVRVRGQRPARRHVEHGGPPAGQPLRREAGKRAVVFTANDDGDAAAADLQSCRRGHRPCWSTPVRGAGWYGRGASRGFAAVDLGDGSRSSATCSSPPSGGRPRRCSRTWPGTARSTPSSAARFVPGPEPARRTCSPPAGSSATGSLGRAGRARPGRGSSRRRRGRATAAADDVPALAPKDHPALFRSTTHGFVDYSEDVSSKDIYAAAKEGYDSVELLKRYTTVTMGQAQGKLETHERRGGARRGHGTHHRGDRDHRLAAALRADQPRRPRRPDPRAGPLLAHAAVARGPPSPADRRRGVDPPGALRRRGRRGSQRARERRAHRRDASRQARSSRPGRAEAAQLPLRQQVVEARHRRSPLRRDVQRGRRRAR